MMKKYGLILLFILSVLSLQAQSTNSDNNRLGELKGGIRIQKSQKLYWENGFALDFKSPKLANNRLHLGISYVSSRLGSAMGSNAIKQDNFLLNLGYFFRPEKQLQPFTRLNMGFFHADYESAIFDVLDNNAFLISADVGLSYEFNAPIALHLSVGYNINSGTGTSGPGTLYPIYYQMSIFYTLFKQK